MQYKQLKDIVEIIDDALKAEVPAQIDPGEAKGSDDDANASSDHETRAPGASAPGPTTATRQAEAAKLFHSHVRLIIESDTKTELAKTLRISPLCTKENANLLILLDCGGFGESANTPEHRRPPLHQPTYEKLINGTLLARSGQNLDGDNMAPKLKPGNIVCLIDGGTQRRSNLTKFARGRTSDKKISKKHCTIILDETSVRENKARLKGVRSLHPSRTFTSFTRAAPASQWGRTWSSRAATAPTCWDR